ncbi:MAG: hypothetical protein RBT63_02625 [Bdellovibrionales bacterium]|nr:hypothetical protein [Bdellovibrionales bacterium]
MSLKPLSLFLPVALALVATERGQASAKQVLKKEPARVLGAMSTPLKSGHPLRLLVAESTEGSTEGSKFQFAEGQRHSKWSVLFDTPLRLESVEVVTCEGTKAFEDGIELLLDHDSKRFFRDGGRKSVTFDLGARGKSSSRARSRTLARSLTLNFFESSGLCLERVRLRTGSDEWIRPRLLEVTGSTVLADGMIGMGVVYPPLKRSSERERKIGEWSLNWETPLIVESLQVWNGNQHPGDAFTESERVKELEVRLGDSGAIPMILEDRRFSQQLDFKEPRAARSLRLKAKSSYEGTEKSEPMLGEIRLLAGGETWFPIADSVAENPGVKMVRDLQYGDILDRELRYRDRADLWQFRFRSDGTFFARVFADKARLTRGWSATGMWRVVSKEDKASGALGLALVGVKLATHIPIDGLPCANRCYVPSPDRGPSSIKELPVLEEIELEREGANVFFLRNRTEPDKRTLDFSNMKVRIHSLLD